MTDLNSDFMISTALPRSFLTALFSRCPATSFLTLSLIHPIGVSPVPSRHLALDHRGQELDQALTRAAAANRQGWGTYFGVATRSTALGRWQRGGKRDLACLPALFVDIDHPERAMLDRLKACRLPPTYIVGSGQGLHAYWQLVRPTADFAAAEALMRRLTRHFSADTQTSCAHSLRLPGSWNTKYDPPLPCALLWFDQTALYDLPEFQALLGADTRQAVGSLATGNYTLGLRQARTGQRPVTADLQSRGSGSSLQTGAQPASTQVADVLVRNYGGYLKSNGFIASLCPFPHARDRPGAHFNFDPRSGTGYCFGKHGRIQAALLASLVQRSW